MSLTSNEYTNDGPELEAKIMAVEHVSWIAAAASTTTGTTVPLSITQGIFPIGRGRKKYETPAYDHPMSTCKICSQTVISNDPIYCIEIKFIKTLNTNLVKFSVKTISHQK